MKRALAYLAAFCHGISAAMNLMGMLYNLQKVHAGEEDNMKDVLIHAFELSYHVLAVYRHIQEAQRKEAKCSSPSSSS